MSGWPFRDSAESTRDGIQWQCEEDDGSETSSLYSTQNYDRLGNSKIRAPDIGRRLRTLYKSEKFADVTFTIKTSKKMKSSLSAHKAILAIGSTYFEQMLYSQDALKPPDTMLEIEITNISFEAFRNIVEYLYTDEVYFENDSLVIETMISSKKFEIQSLADKCESFFDARELTEENVCHMLQLALTNKMESLKNRCIQFVQENTSNVLRSSTFFASNLTTIRTIFKCQQLNLRSDAELYEAAVKWSQKSGGGNPRSQIESLLKCIRFLSLTPNEFSSLIQRFPNILSDKETLDIMMYITNPPRGGKKMDLPSWVNKEVKSRCVPTVTDLSIRDKNESITIPLRPLAVGQKMEYLKSFLEMRCLRGRHRIKSIKLLFEDLPNETRRIGHLTLRIRVFPSGFKHEENLRIDNSSSVVVELSRRVLAKEKDVVQIEADAQEVENYRFLQFDTTKKRAANTSFECTVASQPKWEKLFCISEVRFCPQTAPTAKGKRR